MQKRIGRWIGVCLLLAGLAGARCVAAEKATDLLRQWQIRQVGTLPLVRCPDAPLVFTRQFHPFEGDPGKLGEADLQAQLKDLLGQLNRALGPARSSVESAVRLNFCLSRDEDRVGVQALLQRLAPLCRASLSFVSGRLPHAGQLLALDAVAISYVDPVAKPHQALVMRMVSGYRPGDMKLLHRGRRVFVSGQAVRDESPAAAARKTMRQLGQTLQFLGLSWTNVVQVRSFLQPIESSSEVTEAIAGFFPTNDPVPQVLVEWTMKSPIEIELVVNGGNAPSDAPMVEYLTPPGMKASPVYSRVARVNRGALVFTSSLYGPTDQGVEYEVREIFRELEASMKDLGGDLRHLVKATYYVSTPESSRALNQLRPEFYDPKRPPAASKASVRGTGLPGHRINLDLIGVVR